MKKRNLFFSFALLSVALFMVVSGLLISNNNEKTHFKGDVFINGTNVNGYTIEKANQVVADKMATDLQDINIKIVYQDKVWQFTQEDFDASGAIKDVVNSAFNKNKIYNKNDYTKSVGSYETQFASIFKNFNNKIDDIIDQINIEPENAYVEFTPDNSKIFNVIEGKNGVEADKEKLIADLTSQLFKTKDILVYVNTKTLQPEIKSDYFDNKLNLQSKFTTSIKDSQAGRRNNVTLALKKINGKVIKPNELVSFNALTGPQDASSGYQDAIVILNGKFTNGMGGGICQASSTLYNALVLANLDIEEVHKHTLPVRYVELSLDAMVSDGYADLIFKNTSADDVYIKAYVNGDDATVEIYGNTIPEGVTIKRVAEFIGNIPHNGDKIIPDTNGEYRNKVLYKGEYFRVKYPCEGYEAKAFKEYYKGDKLVKREQIRHEKYQPQDGIIIEGTEDLPEGFVLPEQTVEFIKPEAE